MMLPMRTTASFALIILFPAFALATELININTADVALLDTLPGIGPSKATAIIDYRAKNGLFATTKDIQKVKGIGSGVTFTNIEKLITIGATSAPSASETVVPVQPPAPVASYKPMKAVEPITSPKKNIQAHEQAVIAPTAAVEPATVGAALPPAETAPTAPRASGLFHSPWTLGLLGVIALAGGVFIFF